MKKYSMAILALIACSIIACKPKQVAVVNVSYKGAQAVIYQTKADYSKNVPVTLSDDKTQIVSYPAPSDVYYQGQLAYPTKLEKGYLLDNRGITPNSAFLKLTYEEYSKLKEVPSLSELYKLIIDKDPFTSIYSLGQRGRFTNELDDINQIIKNGQLTSYKKLK